MLEIAEARAAELLLHRDAMDAERAELRPQVARKLVAAVDLVRARRNLRGRETAHAVAQHIGRLAQREIEANGEVGDHGGITDRDGLPPL